MEHRMCNKLKKMPMMEQAKWQTYKGQQVLDGQWFIRIDVFISEYQSLISTNRPINFGFNRLDYN